MISKGKHVSDSWLAVHSTLRCCARYLLLDLRLIKLGKVSGFLFFLLSW